MVQWDDFSIRYYYHFLHSIQTYKLKLTVLWGVKWTDWNRISVLFGHIWYTQYKNTNTFFWPTPHPLHFFLLFCSQILWTMKRIRMPFAFLADQIKVTLIICASSAWQSPSFVHPSIIYIYVCVWLLIVYFFLLCEGIDVNNK